MDQGDGGVGSILVYNTGMKKTIVCLLSLILVSLTLSACKPPGYTTERKKQITKEHAGEAKLWFSNNLSEAKVKSGEAYTDSRDLFAVIEGNYEYQGQEYEYMYDYHNGNMYLGYEYESAKEIAADAVREYFGENVKAIDMNPAQFSFYTECENDNGGQYGSSENGATIICDGLTVLPAGSDPLKYANIMITEGFEGTYYSSAKMFVDILPKYNTNTLSVFKGVRNLEFVIPADLEFNGVYKVAYSFDAANYYHLRLVKISEDLYGGYYYTERVSYDESGAETSHEGVYDDSAEFVKDNGDGSYTFQLPGDKASILIFSKKKVKVSRMFKTYDGTEKKVLYDEFWKYESEFGKDYDSFFNDINLSKSKYKVYSEIGSPKEDNNEYTVIIE